MCNRFRFANVAASAMFFFSAASCLRAEERVALVIGNGDYVHSKSLPNPPNDAGDVAASLKRLGFSVTTVLNATYTDLGAAIRAFNIQAQGADIGLIYYAGHGMELGGENWLIPVDADLKTDLDLANAVISVVSGVAYPADKLERGRLRQAREALEPLLDL